MIERAVMPRAARRWRARAASTAALTVAAAIAMTGCSSTPPSEQGDDDQVLIGFANITSGDPTLTAMEEVLKAQAEKRGWEVLILNNNLDGPTALKNADTMIARGVDYVIEFQVDSTVQPVIAEKFADAGIPEIVYDIPAPGAYFVGAPNAEAGRLAGVELGNYAKDTWECAPDLVILVEQATAGDPSTLRTNGVREGLLEICPDISEDIIVQRDGGASADTAQAAGRDILAAYPNAEKILAGGLNDTNVIGIINAATQLGRAGGLFAWGNDGSGLLSGTFPPELKGSVAYFIPGYPIYALDLIERLEAGEDVPVGDTPTSADAILVDACVISAEQAADVPNVEEQAKQLADAPTGTSAYELFCPTK